MTYKEPTPKTPVRGPSSGSKINSNYKATMNMFLDCGTLNDDNHNACEPKKRINSKVGRV